VALTKKNSTEGCGGQANARQGRSAVRGRGAAPSARRPPTPPPHAHRVHVPGTATSEPETGCCKHKQRKFARPGPQAGVHLLRVLASPQALICHFIPRGRQEAERDSTAWAGRRKKHASGHNRRRKGGGGGGCADATGVKMGTKPVGCWR
jgi:hypothetical protein